jgi:hypothetical protein
MGMFENGELSPLLFKATLKFVLSGSTKPMMGY